MNQRDFSRNYRRREFTGRVHELNLVSERVQRTRGGEIADVQLINFWGVRGVGKTWLLNHLCDLYTHHPESVAPGLKATICLFFCFFEPKLSIEEIIHNFVEQIRDQVPPIQLAPYLERIESIKAHPDLAEFVCLLQALSEQFAPVILFDNADQIPNEWETLEQDLVEPLLTTNRVFFVVAGRRQVPRWRRFEVRRRVMEADQTEITPLSEKDVSALLHVLDFSQVPASIFMEYTAGNPKLVYDLYTFLKKNASFTASGWIDQHREELLQILETSQNELVGHIPFELNTVLMKVFSLRYFRLEALRYMLESGDKKSDVYYLGLLRRMEGESNVIVWDRKQRAYVINQIVRQVINRHQLLRDRRYHSLEYQTAHQRALEMYTKWAQSTPATSEDLILEIWYHLASLYWINQDQSYLDTITEYLEFAGKNLTNERFLILEEQFKRDAELRQILPGHLEHSITQQLVDRLSTQSH